MGFGTRRRGLLAGLLIVFVSGAAGAQEETPVDAGHWPSFRGHRATGVAESHETPVEWDVPTGKNVLWKTPIPGLAHSSPVIWGNRLFVTTADRQAGAAELSSLFGSPGYGAGDSVEDEGVHSFDLYCLDRTTGEVLWKQTAHTGVPKVKRHPKSSHANSTPACDAERVVAFFGSEGLHCYDHAGELLWSRDFGVLDAGAPDIPAELVETYQWGFASSPILHGDKVIVQCDVQDQSFVAALDAKSGKELWRTARNEAPTWCTPTVYETADGEELVVLNGYHHIGGYDLATGAERWTLSGGGDVPVPAPVVAHGLIFLTSAHGRLAPLYAVDVSAAGALTTDPDESEDMAWYHARRGIYMQTPLVYGYELYACSDGGILSCFDAGTGDSVYRERLGTGRTGFSGSAVAADGKLYFTGESGTVHVVRAGLDFALLAENDLGEVCMSTPAISTGVLFFRTRGHVVAISVRASDH